VRADIYEYYKRQTAADGLQPYAAVRLFRRQAGRPDNGNHLESGEIRGSMRVGLSDEGQKTLELIFTFFKTLFLSFPKSGRFVPSAQKTGNFCRYKK
jgi:hypothetical protein